MAKSKKQITPSEKKQIGDMTQEGVTDRDIAKELNRHLGTIGFITTQYWENKMKNKDKK